MTALVFIVCLILGAAWFYTLGPFLFDGITIYTGTFFATTACAAIFCGLSGDRSKYAAGGFIITYSILAPQVYLWENALIWSAVIDLIMAGYFILLGAKRWEIYAGLCFLLAVAVSVLTAVGIVPGPAERAYMFIAFSQPDITAICGHAANIVIGLGAADGGRKIFDYLATRRVVGDFGRGFGFMFLGNEQAAQEG